MSSNATEVGGSSQGKREADLREEESGPSMRSFPPTRPFKYLAMNPTKTRLARPKSYGRPTYSFITRPVRPQIPFDLAPQKGCGQLLGESKPRF